MCSEKQANFASKLIDDLEAKLESLGDEIDSALATEISKKITAKQADVIATMQQEATSATASTVIEMLLDFNNRLKPANEVSWRKYEGKWVVAGAAKNMRPGATMVAVSKKGKQEVTIEKIVYNDGNNSYATIVSEETKVPDIKPGFYYDANRDIIEAYVTKSGFTVARRILSNGKKGEYLGKQGLALCVEALTKEEAQEFGRETGICLSCGKLLTDPESISLGLGPVCAGKW